MSIKESIEKIKPFYTLFLLVVVASIFFAFGRFSGLKDDQESIKIEYAPESQTSAVISSIVATSSKPKTVTVSKPAPSGEVIGSKSGKKYYFPWCGTVKRIKPENQVHFASIEDARKAGFTPGGNCKGLK